MKCGILHEGKYDPATIEKIVASIVWQVKPGVYIDFSHLNARGTIAGSLGEAVENFFVIPPCCDFAVFFHDFDNNQHKLTLLKRSVKRLEVKHGNIKKIAIASPKPTLEEWFFREEVAIKNIFGINHQDRIPYPELKPKQRLMKLYAASDRDEVTSPNDIYEELAERLDPNSPHLMKDRYYRLFRNELTSILRSTI